MITLTRLQKLAMNLASRGKQIGDIVDSIISKINLFEAINTSTPTGANQTVTLVSNAKTIQMIAAHATPPTGGITLLLPDLAESVGRRFLVINNSVLTVTVKGKAGDTGVAIATTKTAEVLVLADNTVKRLTADI